MENIINKYGILRNKDLKMLNRFATGGAAEYFFAPKSKGELIDFLKDNELDVTILGGGTNVLIRDKGIKGVVITTKYLNGYVINNDLLICDSGLSNAKLYAITRDRNIGGYEFLATIPGAIGGACVTNAGCYGGEIGDNVVKVEVCDKKGNVRYLTKEECFFTYRNSVFTKNDIILSVYFKIDNYKAKEEIEKIFIMNKQKREETQPCYEKTCGSTFKNYKDKAAWKIIQELGLQNVDFGGCKFSEKHANFLINHNNCTSTDIENLINHTQKKALEEKGINLELEVKILGEQ
jgi:UDP-N-acetylmuramate dehydrogenase